jgi:hypothetical protein
MRSDDPLPHDPQLATGACGPGPDALGQTPADGSPERDHDASPSSPTPMPSCCGDATPPPPDLPRPSVPSSRATPHWRAPHHRRWQTSHARRPSVCTLHVWLTTRRALLCGARVDSRDLPLR